MKGLSAADGVPVLAISSKVTADCGADLHATCAQTRTNTQKRVQQGTRNLGIGIVLKAVAIAFLACGWMGGKPTAMAYPLTSWILAAEVAYRHPHIVGCA